MLHVVSKDPLTNLPGRRMAASTNGGLVEDYRARLDGFKKSDAERVTLVNVQVPYLSYSIAEPEVLTMAGN